MSIIQQFQEQVIDRVNLIADNRPASYIEYLQTPTQNRTGDEANAVDQQFSRYVLEWLGFTPGDWTYNQPVNGQKADRPDYVVRATVGVAFIWENKNSTLDLEDKHIQQMRRYATGTGGYAVWCNMRRILAIRFSSGDSSNYDIVTNVAIEKIYGNQGTLDFEREAQEQNLALLQLLFSKERFTQFANLVAKIAQPEADFEKNASPLSERNTLRQFISDSRQSLDHLRLAALSQIRDAVTRDALAETEEKSLRAEWESAKNDLIAGVGHNGGSVRAGLEQLIPGETDRSALQRIEAVVRNAHQTERLSATLRVHFDKWLERAERNNAALRAIRFTRRNTLRVAEAYRTWVSNQRDPEDARPETFAEQVAYVFFVRLLLVRVLEDKKVLSTRIASDGGFAGWINYLHQHFAELDGISILNDNFCSLLTRKAGSFYLHFFQQPVFDWFIPDDFLLVETLEFLCRYNFQSVASDVIGFTYEEYIDRNARNRKGHFLTRPEVVDYMLDLLGYNTPSVIGQKVLDPACGSGSFLVHAARRYRAQVVTALCRRERLPEAEGSLTVRPELRRELARTYIDGLTANFHGMEINPFSCYLAEMNLLIQSLDDLAYLQQNTDEPYSIERFRIFNTNSLELPYTILHTESLPEGGGQPAPTDNLSDRITDEAFPVKAKLDDFAGGFTYIIFNPPYVSGKREEIGVQRLRNASFFASVLSGDTNLFLLFLKLASYYLADYGSTVFIIPLTIFGDRSSAAARKLLRTPPLAPSATVRFYRGDVLFPGVDQAVGILRVDKNITPNTITVAGGNTVAEVKANQYELLPAAVLDAVPADAPWNGAWLVSSDPIHAAIWDKAKHKSLQLVYSLGSLINAAFAARQGDVNATHLNPYRAGRDAGTYAGGQIAVYKGEDVNAFAPLPAEPSDWVTPKTTDEDDSALNRVLNNVKGLETKEVGIVRRQVARLNTRERLTATWFERDATKPFIFTHATWRLVLRSDVSEKHGKALLALITSETIAFLFNLFSSNNNISKEDFDRVPVPSTQFFPETELSATVDKLLSVYSSLEEKYLNKYKIASPNNDEVSEDADAPIYLPPDAVLAADTTRRKVTVSDLVLRGVLQNTGANTQRLLSLNRSNRITIAPPTGANPDAVTETLRLFLNAPARQNRTWAQIQADALPDPVATADFLAHYRAETEAAQSLWKQFIAGQNDVDRIVADWYGFTDDERAAIAAGLPWARRRLPTPPPGVAIAYASRTQRETVESSLIAAIGYDETESLLEVELVSGDIYAYAPATPELFQAFRVAPSKGTFYNEQVKGAIERYPPV